MARHHRPTPETPANPRPVVFLTAAVRDRRCILADDAPFETLRSVWRNAPEADGWFVGDFLLMPDHVHLFAQPGPDAKSLAGWVATWKSISARLLGPTVGGGRLWQDDQVGRFIRSPREYEETWACVRMNPVRNGLCGNPEEWPWKGRILDLRFRRD